MILFIDDERRYMEGYLLELQLSTKHNVMFQRDVDKAIDFFREHQNEISLLILDIMMSTGETFKEHEDEAGLKTGLHVLEYVKTLKPKLPVMVLSNVTDHHIKTTVRNTEGCSFYSKADYLPFQFVELVEKIIKSHRRDS